MSLRKKKSGPAAALRWKPAPQSWLSVDDEVSAAATLRQKHFLVSRVHGKKQKQKVASSA